METKEQLVNAIRDWVRIDNEMRKLKNEISNRKNEQKLISSNLVEVMRKNQIDEFDLNDGKIMYTKKSVKKPITKKILLNVLANYYNGDIEKANALNEYIMINRQETEIETIIRKINK